MAIHAGFAYVVQLRQRALNDAILLAYHSGSWERRIDLPLPDGPPEVYLQAFLGLPGVDFQTGNNRQMRLLLNGRGFLAVDFLEVPAQPRETREIEFQIEVLIEPRFAVGTGTLELALELDDFEVGSFTFRVLGGELFGERAQNYLTGPAFRQRLSASIAGAFAAGLFSFPPIEFGALGPAFDIAGTAAIARIDDESILVGLNLDSAVGKIVGEIPALASFCGSRMIGLAVHPDAVRLAFATGVAEVEQEVAAEGATLTSLDITLDHGKLKIAGAAEHYAGSATFSFDVDLHLQDFVGGALFQYTVRNRTPHVKEKTFPAIRFAVNNIMVEVNPATWIKIVEVVSGRYTYGVGPLIIGHLIAGATNQITDSVRRVPLPGSIPRVQTRPPLVPGNPGVKVRISDFEIEPDAIFAGIDVTPQIRPPALLGFESLPVNLAGRPARYRLRMPVGVFADDPYLFVDWHLQNLTTGEILLDQTLPAVSGLERDFVFASLVPDRGPLGISVTLRRIVPGSSELLFEDGFRIDIVDNPPPGSFVRWNCEPLNPQIEFDARKREWRYRGESRIARSSALHRLDKPCLMATKRSRFSNGKAYDVFPLPLTHDPDRLRKSICSYCFFGGPGRERPRF